MKLIISEQVMELSSKPYLYKFNASYLDYIPRTNKMLIYRR